MYTRASVVAEASRAVQDSAGSIKEVASFIVSASREEGVVSRMKRQSTLPCIHEADALLLIADDVEA